MCYTGDKDKEIMTALELPAFICTEMIFSQSGITLWWIDEEDLGSGQITTEWLEILRVDKAPGNLHPNLLQEMEVDIRNALVGLFKSVGDLEGARRRCAREGSPAAD